MENETRSFMVLEAHFIAPDLIGKVRQNYDYQIRYLDVLIDEIHNFFTAPVGTKFGLIRYGDFLGNYCPAIGIVCEDEADYEKIPDHLDLYNIAEEFINLKGFEYFIEKSKSKNSVTWDYLVKNGWYFRWIET